DDLRQHGSGDLVATLGVEHHEFSTALHHLAQIIERDVAAGRGVVEPAVGVFLDYDRREFRSRAFRAGSALLVCHEAISAVHEDRGAYQHLGTPAASDGENLWSAVWKGSLTADILPF